MSDHKYSVKQISTYIKQTLDAESMLENVLVFGEVSSYNIARDIAYFNIKDEDSMLNCVLFDAAKYGEIKLGDMIVVRGSIKYYVKGGRLSFNATSIMQYGKGALYQKFLELKSKLYEEGLFDQTSKKSLPPVIKRVGVITSRTGAVIRDIINVASRRNPMLDIVLYHVQVQGALAKNEILKAIEFFSDYGDVDVIIIARGGGSLEDLQPFNEEAVARAAIACKKPILSAIGHETDFTILDFVSDMRAPTPSAAAELVTTDYTNVISKINSIKISLESDLNKLTNIFSRNITHSVVVLNNTLNRVLSDDEHRLDRYQQHIDHIVKDSIQEHEYKLGIILNNLEKTNPISILKKGYVITTSAQRRVTSVCGIRENDIVDLKFADGMATAKIQKIEENK